MDIQTTRSLRWISWLGGAVVLLSAILLLGVAAFPFGSFKASIEGRLSDRFGRPVTIGSIARLDRFSFTPTIALRDVRVPQAAWAGPGDLARIGAATVRFRILPLLVAGRLSPESVRISGLRLSLVRAADGRKSWAKPGDAHKSGTAPDIHDLQIADSQITYRDAKADRSFSVSVVADSAKGMRIDGTGVVRGAPVRVTGSGGSIEGASGKPWPFHAVLEGNALGMDATGTMDRPLDTGHMTLDLVAHASDLRLIDGVIEAGLIGTQAVQLKAHVRRASPDWTITALAGTIGRSDLAGHVTVLKRDGRTKLDGAVVSNALDFDDLSSSEGRAKAAALESATGARLVPNTRINLARIDRTDGTLTFEARHLLDRSGSSSLTYLKGAVSLDHQVLTLAPFTLGLRQGAITGTVKVDQHGGAPVPLVTIDLAIHGSSIAAIAGGGGKIDGGVEGRARLVGQGSTIREAVGRSDGAIGLVAREGVLPARIAAMLGFDVSRSLFTGAGEQAGLRCLVLRLEMQRGLGRVAPMVIDTTESQSQGVGTVSFPSEAVDIRLTGAPKQHSLLRLPGSVTMQGTIRDPRLYVPADIKSVGNIFKAIGRAITGRQGADATDADCGALAAQALAG